ncbi:hypothetical protein V3C99_008571 [Haemonchus contortus]
MAEVIDPDVNISRRRKRNPKHEDNYEDHGSTYEDEFDEDFMPAKRGRLLNPKPLRNLNSYDSIQNEVNKEKQRKTPARKPKPLKSTSKRDEAEEAEDPEMRMSARMVDRIAALNDGKRTKVVMANCFEDRTALDCIDICLRESENMQEDAVALAIATAVYSLRVDRTHNDAQETRYTFIRGKSDAEKAMLLATGENIENAKEKRRRKKGEEEARKMAEAEMDEFQNNDTEQEDWLKLSDSDTFDYTFGLKFPIGGSFLQHWSFTQELLERVECRRLEARKNRRKRKLMSWKKIPPLKFCSTYTDFMQVTANLESDRIDALATFQARRDITGKVIMLHDAMIRKPVPQSKYADEVQLSTLKHCRDMLSNALQKEPVTWDHFLLDDNPLLYKSGQYLRTGDMTGYVLQERPFYHHFDPEEESADDPRDRYNCVEKNADKTLYTFKKPPRGTALGRLAPLIRVPVNKYANPRNRKIEDMYFKESVEVKSSVDEGNKLDLVKLTADARKQLENRKVAAADVSLVNFHFSPSPSVQKAGTDLEEIEGPRPAGRGSLLSRLKDEHEKQTAIFENLRNELTQAARTRCNSVVKECCEARANLSNDADKEEVDEEDIKEWRTSRFLDIIEPKRELTFFDTLNNVFSKIFDLPNMKDDESESRKQDVASILGTGSDVVEWNVPEDVIFNDIVDFVKCGIHNDVRYMDATYHMKVFKFRVSVEQAHESLRRAERVGAGMAPEELAVLKQKCFRPGRYNGIADSGEVSRFYRVDPWCMTSSTLLFSEQYFRCCNYPRMEGRLLQLRNDIHEAAKKIAASSWYHVTVRYQEIEKDRRNWLERLNEAVALYVSYMDKPEEKSLRENRSLPKISRRSLPPKSHTQNSQKALNTPTPRHSHPDTAEVCIDRENSQHSLNEEILDGGDFAFPEDDLCANVEEEVRAIVDRPAEESVEASAQQSDVIPDTSNRKGKTKLDTTVEEPPKKKEKKIKTEPEVKVEVIEQEYFVKSEVHEPFSLENRFSIVDRRCTTRGEDVTFLRRKPPPRRSLKEYKFEDFVKPGLIQRGHYPGIKLEIKRSPSSSELPFNGTLKRSSTSEESCQKKANIPEAGDDVCDEWLTTYGGFRILPEDGQTVLENGTTSEAPLPSLKGEGSRSRTISENEGAPPDFLDDSFNDDVYYPDSDDSSRKDRFEDIRPDEFKALGIDVKNIVPKKDFYAMTKEERAAAVAAEFEAIDALGPKKEDGYVISIMDFSCRVVPYHLNTAKMKRVMKSILSNPLLAYDKVLYTRRALLARRRAAERHKSQKAGPEVYFKKLDRTLDSSLGPVAEKILEEHNPIDITAIDPIDVLEAVTYRNLDDNGDGDGTTKNQYDSTSAGVEESMKQFAAEVRQADFKVQGLHTFSSIMQCLPRRMGNSGKYVNVANALAVTLYMCNENTLTLVQERDDEVDKNESVNEGEPWMGNFIITNAPDVASLLGQNGEASKVASENTSNHIESIDDAADNNRIFS